jgi:hypothetical protein
VLDLVDYHAAVVLLFVVVVVIVLFNRAQVLVPEILAEFLVEVFKEVLAVLLLELFRLLALGLKKINRSW